MHWRVRVVPLSSSLHWLRTPSLFFASFKHDDLRFSVIFVAGKDHPNRLNFEPTALGLQVPLRMRQGDALGQTSRLVSLSLAVIVLVVTQIVQVPAW